MVNVGAASDPGRVRSTNEDYYRHGPVPQGYLAVVCDGMGGHEAGEVAARLAADAVHKFLQEAPPTDDLKKLLHDAILFANQQVLLHTQIQSTSKSPGSTIVAALFTPTHLIYAHVGDSRLYAFSKGELTLLTQDDSLVNQMVASKLITPEQALRHPQRNVLTQSLGQQPPPTPHVEILPLQKNTLYLLCTDGLYGALSREEITSILSLSPESSLQSKAEQLVRQANQNGGYDNITVLLVQSPIKSSTFGANMNFKLPPTKYLIGGGIALIVLVILLLVWSRRSSKTSASGSEDKVITIVDDGATATSNETPSSGSEAQELPNEPPPVPSPAPPREGEPYPPSPKATAPSPAPSKSPANNETAVFEYTIQKGDNLGRIAEAFGVSKNDLRKANGLKDDNIQAGKKLKIPVKDVKYHTVKEKESLSAIARKYGTRIEAIKRANHIEGEKIKVGQKLTIPIVAAKQ
ncbi:MAG: Stp1/IreP family PP2C-type Ser/Thr phosphatase [Bacteroidia bacterium]|nr:Stp1/IreP family PP2C-type Ser/Thr phosphatase [Bacteroidia bacterium]MDW8057350.1 Stp1/IreP family PP2C-type Ser/Thr phosphatase [Bacteroidia bacterium]